MARDPGRREPQGRERGRREPERTCIACRRSGPKRTLLRVVRTPQGEVRLDPTGTQAGRGAYVHRAVACIRAGIRTGAVGRALRSPLGPAEAARLMEDALGSVGEES